MQTGDPYKILGIKPKASPQEIRRAYRNLAKKYHITREEVDQFASDSFAKAVAAQQSGFLAGEIVPMITEKFELDGYKPRGIKLQGKITEVTQDTHPRISPVDVLAKLRPVYEGGVQTGGNSSALVDAAAACGFSRLRCSIQARAACSESVGIPSALRRWMLDFEQDNFRESSR